MRHESENRLDSMMDAAIDQAIAGGQEKDLENAAITLFLKGRDDVELASFHDEILGVFARCRYGCVSAPAQSSSIASRLG